jgi:hypothetical protein
MILSQGTGIVDNIRKIIAPSLVPVHPIGATASSNTADHGPALAIDTFKNTDWQSTEATPSLTVTFQSPIDLGAVYVYSGRLKDFTSIRRPSQLQFIFPDGSSKTVDLVDDPKPQQLSVDANGIKGLQVKVLATAGPDGTPVALSELEFFMKK